MEGGLSLIVSQSPACATPSDRVYPRCEGSRHGTWAAAQKHRCTCPDAVEALRLYTKRRRQGRAQPLRVDSLGSTRRLRALMTIGHTQQRIASELGWSKFKVNAIVIGRHQLIGVTKAREIAAVFERLSGVPGDSQRVRAWAARRGWLAPLAWEDIDNPEEIPDLPSGNDGIDEVAVARACRKGVSSVSLTEQERDEVKRRLLASGAPAHEVARLLGVNVRTVDRWRASPAAGAA